MNNDRWIEASMAPLLLGLLLSSQDVCASSEERWHVISIDDTTVGSMHETEERGDAGWVSTEPVLDGRARDQVERLASQLSLPSP